MSKLTCFFDGLCEPTNPGGVGAWGAVIMCVDTEILAKCGIVGEGRSISNNVAEYSGLINLLSMLLALGHTNDVLIKGDSQLVINQMNGAWAAKGGLYFDYYKRARSIASRFTGLRFDWIPREQNCRADALSRQAYEGHCATKGVPARYMVKTKSFEETTKVLMESRESILDIIIQDEMPVTRRESAKKTPMEFKSIIETAARQKIMQFPNYINDVGELTLEQVKELKSCLIGSPSPVKELSKDTCETCKWLKWKGPHVGCFPNGKYRKWLPKSFIKTNKCEKYACL